MLSCFWKMYWRSLQKYIRNGSSSDIICSACENEILLWGLQDSGHYNGKKKTFQAGLHNMRKPANLVCRHFFFPRHFYLQRRKKCLFWLKFIKVALFTWRQGEYIQSCGHMCGHKIFFCHAEIFKLGFFVQIYSNQSVSCRNIDQVPLRVTQSCEAVYLDQTKPKTMYNVHGYNFHSFSGPFIHKKWGKIDVLYDRRQVT